jgi:hypothetical protein
MSGKHVELATAGAAASGRRGRPAAILAGVAGVLLLLDAALWVLTAVAQADASALTQFVFPSLLLLSGFAALCAVRIVREAPRWAALLCAAAIVPVTVIHLVPTIAYLTTPQGSFPPGTLGLGAFMPPLLTWLAIVTPLVVSVVLALRQPRPCLERAARGSLATSGWHEL